MKLFKKICITVLLAFAFVLPTVSFNVETKEASAAAWLGTKTGYTKASDVKYVTSGGYIANWGARDEDCLFLSKYATAFYTGDYTYNVLSQKKGSSSESSVPSSALYNSLKSLMSSKQDYQTSYNATRDLFRYTDCVNGNSDYISSFYSGERLKGAWGNGWNREHSWPNSKGDKSGNGENDIMMLRPTSTSENSSRGNKAYGEGGAYYNPDELGQSLKGDCARIVLYVYVRWNCTNTGSKYNPNGITGVNGVIESIDMLLDWMEEDPVDTWEMGRNDAVQSITGTRNVFVDYPEYAFLMFGESIPKNMVTPSRGKASGTVTPPASSEEEEDSSEIIPPESSVESVEPELPDEDSGEVDSSMGGTEVQPQPGVGGCEHDYGEWIIVKEATATEDGERWRFCSLCKEFEKEAIPKTGNIGGETSAENTSQTSEDLMGGCVASVGASMSGIFLMLAACTIADKMRRRTK